MKQSCLHALDLWVARPKLSFVDALAAAQAGELGVPLLTFDAELNRLPGITPWRQPDPPDEP
jgi:predicted nucleic acid-binding protein